MTRHIYIPLILIVLAVGIVAMVKAQEWSAWNTVGTPAGQSATQSDMSSRLESLQSQPQIFASEEPRRIQAEGAAALPPRGTGEVQSQATTASPPAWVNNQYVQPTQLGEDVAPLAGSSIAPWPVEQAATHSVLSNRSTAIDQSTQPASSRRASPPEVEATMPPQVEENPHVAARAARPAIPVQEKTKSAGVLLQTTSPTLTVKVSGPPTIAVGKAADYQIVISNPGALAADEVAVFLDIPVWTEVGGAEATIGSARFEPIVDEVGRLKWGTFPLAVGGSETLTLKITPRQSRPLDLAVHSTHKPPAQLAQIEVQEPKLEMSLSGPTEVQFGETKTYTIVLSNPGTGPVENVVVNLLPIAAEQDAPSLSKLGGIEAGGRREIEFALTAGQAGELELRATAFADGGLRSEAAQRVHVRRAALEVVAAGPQVKYAGTVAVYQFQVTNAGDAMADNVVAEAILPSGAAFVSATETGVWQAPQSRVQWPIGSLRAGSSRVLEVRCAMTESGANRLEVVAAADGDLTASANWVTQVESLADLKLLINDPQGPLPTGEPTVYEVRLVNRGTKAAQGVQITAFFSDGLEPTSVDGGAAEIGVGQVIFQPIQRIVAGQELVFKITAKASQAGDHTFRTDVICDTPETKLAAQETTRFYSSAVAQPVAERTVPTEAKLPPLHR